MTFPQFKSQILCQIRFHCSSNLFSWNLRYLLSVAFILTKKMVMQNVTETFFISTLPNILNNKKGLTFYWYDYLLFSIVLGISSLIGIYFGCIRKQNTKKDYLLGGKLMGKWPIAVSLVASHTSAITVLAIPADTYRYGIGFWQGSISLFILYFTTAYIFLPVFYKLELTSTYEYLALRFDEKTRMMASALFAISLMLYLPIVIYVPSLGFAAATGTSIHVIAPICCAICVFYTTIGGLKAVVWSDTFQFMLTIGCLLAVLWLALLKAGGLVPMWQTAVEGHRLDIDFDLDPTKRDAFWAVVIGLTFLFTAQNSINQGCVQKLLALPTIEDAKTSCFIYATGTISVKTISVFIGLSMYSFYSGCDPLATKQVSRTDQLVPYFVMDIGSTIPGLCGLFFAGVFCSALSTLSANLNCVAGTLYTDFVSKFMGPNVTEETVSNTLKLMVVVTGVTSCLMIYVIEHLGGIVQLSVSIKGIADGPLLGIFLMGVFSKRFNSKGAFYGSISAMFLMTAMFSMVKYYENQGFLKHDFKPWSVSNCTEDLFYNFTTTNASAKPSNEHIFLPFRISFYYYTMLGALCSILIGSLISFCTQETNNRVVPKKLLTPIIHWLYEDEEDEIPKNGNAEYMNIQDALQLVAKNAEHEK